MNFIDEDSWSDLEALERDHAELTDESVQKLHERLRPYFLRRLKIDVLDLPPKVSFKVLMGYNVAECL
jgi:chromodomain-helicase-DNA-binding protein 4